MSIMYKQSGKSGKPAVRKLKLKNFSLVKLPETFAEDTWKTLLDAVQAIHSQKAVDTTLEILYQSVQRICSQGAAQDVYQKLAAEFSNHLKHIHVGLAAHIEEEPMRFLAILDAAWSSHCDQVILIRGIFLFLDRSYAYPTTGVEPIWELGLTLLRTHVVEKVLSTTTKALLQAISRERGGEQMDSTRIQRLVKMLVALDLYKGEHFEDALLADASDHFALEAKQTLETVETSVYMSYAERRLTEEADRAASYFDIATQKLLLDIVERCVITTHMEEILRSGLCKLLIEERHSDLARMYMLFGRVDGHGMLKDAFAVYVMERGKDIVLKPERDKMMVEELLKLKKQLDEVVAGPFQSSPAFVASIKTTFEDFINKRPNKPAEMIAKFFDAKLRTGYKECTEDVLEDIFDRTMVLFRFINGKDVFEAFYKNYLARRLLLQKSASDDAERTILSKLKHECGSGFTSKLEGMFKDIKLSAELSTSFRDTVQRDTCTSIDLTVSVLTSSHWPTYTPVEIPLPLEVSELQTAFTQFYTSNHRNRKLTWETALGHCLISGNFPKGSKDLQMSIYQGSVLLAFNQASSLSAADIQQKLKLSAEEIARTLQSLACGKVRVLTKTPKSRDVSPSDTFEVNLKFENKHKRVKINQIQLKETQKEAEQTQEKVFEDRVFSVDAAIVRIMKSRKKISHNDLISELFAQLKFPVKASDLKKRIESLMDREYLQRDGKDSSKYVYMA